MNDANKEQSSTAGAAKGGATSIKRYDGFYSYDGGGPAEMEESADGKYVKFSDVESFLPPLTAPAPTNQPIELELPDGDSRTVKVWWDEVKDGKRHVCISVEEDPARQAELSNERIIEIASTTHTAESRDGDYILPISFARAIEREVRATQAATAAPVQAEQAHILEQIAQSWDGCMVDAPGETMDVGATLRSQFKQLPTAPSLRLSEQDVRDQALTEAARKAMAEGARHLRAWLELSECECEGSGHSCGKPAVERACEKLEELAALRAPSTSQTSDGESA